MEATRRKLEKYFEEVYLAMKAYHWEAVVEASEHIGRLDALIKLVDQLKSENTALRAEVQTLKRMIANNGE